MKKLAKYIFTMIMFMLIIKSINVFSFYIADIIYPFFKLVDPDKVFIVLIIHHLIQAAIVLFLIIFVSKLFNLSIKKDFGFNLNKISYSIKSVICFAAIWIVIQSTANILFIYILKETYSFPFPLNEKNFIGYFLFQLLLSGTSEEIMYRAFVITAMLYLYKNFFEKKKFLHIIIIISSVFIFMYDHVNFNLFPLKIVYIDIKQQLICIIYGIYYGYLFIKTRSIIGPMLAHNLLNAVNILLTLIFII